MSLRAGHDSSYLSVINLPLISSLTAQVFPVTMPEDLPPPDRCGAHLIKEPLSHLLSFPAKLQS